MSTIDSVADRRRQIDVLQQWEDARSGLCRINVAVRDLLDALNDYRRGTYLAADLVQIDAYACDAVAGGLDLLNNLRAPYLKRADEAGLHHSNVPLDLFALEDEHARWDARWAASSICIRWGCCER